jgi:hypothetical protein
MAGRAVQLGALFVNCAHFVDVLFMIDPGGDFRVLKESSNSLKGVAKVGSRMRNLVDFDFEVLNSGVNPFVMSFVVSSTPYASPEACCLRMVS